MAENVSRKRDKALAALASGSTRAEAAKVAGCSERQLYRWLQEDAGFAKELHEAMRIEREAERAASEQARRKRLEALGALAERAIERAGEGLEKLSGAKLTARTIIALGDAGERWIQSAHAGPAAGGVLTLTPEEIEAMTDEELEAARYRAEREAG